MFTDNLSTVGNTVAKTSSSLFTASSLKLNTNTKVMKAQQPPAQTAYQKTAKIDMSASFGSSQPKLAMTNSVLSMQDKKQFFGAPAPVQNAGSSSYSAMAQSAGRAPQAQMKMSMFGAASSKPAFEVKHSPVPTSLGHPMAMNRSTVGTNNRTNHVVMQATTKVEGETNIQGQADYMDNVFLQQKYDNADHLDPVLKYEGNKFVGELMTNAKLLSAQGKGILASDESNMTCGKRFIAQGIENTTQNRNDWRELLYSVPGMEQFVSGCIMYDETIRQNARDGRPLVKVLADKGILTGIKVDTGISVIEGTNEESQTNGLDGLSERAAEYYAMGARFAKWRAVLKITDDGCPSEAAIKETAHSLARYAAICQHAGLVPIVEPEILSDGKHDIKTCARVSERVLAAVMEAVQGQRVWQEGMLLKPNMITSGAQAEVQASPEEVAFFTVRTLARTIPPAVPGVTFLSGGQSEEIACQNLSAINASAVVKHPWNLTFSFGRALQSSVLILWDGKQENFEAAQQRLYERCQAASEAAQGKYTGGAGSTASDYVANYVY